MSAATIGSSALLSLIAFSATRKLLLMLRLEDDDESAEDDEFKYGGVGGISVAAIVTLLR